MVRIVFVDITKAHLLSAHTEKLHLAILLKIDMTMKLPLADKIYAEVLGVTSRDKCFRADGQISRLFPSQVHHNWINLQTLCG